MKLRVSPLGTDPDIHDYCVDLRLSEAIRCAASRGALGGVLCCSFWSGFLLGAGHADECRMESAWWGGIFQSTSKPLITERLPLGEDDQSRAVGVSCIWIYVGTQLYLQASFLSFSSTRFVPTLLIQEELNATSSWPCVQEELSPAGPGLWGALCGCRRRHGPSHRHRVGALGPPCCQHPAVSTGPVSPGHAAAKAILHY